MKKQVKTSQALTKRQTVGRALLYLVAGCTLAGFAYAKKLPVPSKDFGASAAVGAQFSKNTSSAVSTGNGALGQPTTLKFTQQEDVASFQQGAASWYGPGFHNRLTANGERFDMNAMTAAHKTLPFGTIVLVKSKQTGKTVTVRINDRGPYVKGRIIDLSRAAAKQLGMQSAGVYKVALYRYRSGAGKKPTPITR